MTFPEEPLDVRVELQIGDEWTDVTADAQTESPVTITCGRAAHGTLTDPSSCTFQLNNAGGKYSPRNPRSPYYGLIGRNTPVRVSVPGSESYLALSGDPDDYASTPDTAALDITADIDIRAELDIDWHSDLNQTIIGQWDPDNEAGWMLRLRNGEVTFHFYNAADGVISFIPFQELTRSQPRMAIRVTVDFDASSIDANLYWADSLDGEWTLLENLPLGAPVGSGLIPSTVPLRIGPHNPTSNPPRVPFTGRGYRFEIRAGVDGTVVASPDFRDLAPGTTVFTDSAGLEWALAGDAAVSNRETRFSGEVSAWPVHWTPGNHKEWVSVQAAGVLRRLGQGTKPLESALRRRVPSYSPLAYWPMEEGASATRAYSPIDGVLPLRTTGFTYALDDSLASSGPLPQIRHTGSIISLRGSVPAPTGPITGWQVRWVYRRDEGPAIMRTHLLIQSTGTVAEWFVQQSATGSRLLTRNRDGDTVFSIDIATGSDLYGQWVSTNLRVAQNGSDIDWFLTWQDVGGDAGTASGTTAGTIGRVTGVASPGDGYSTDLEGMTLGHIGVFGSTTTAAYENAITAWAGETCWERLLRLSAEESLPLRLYGSADDSTALGAQRQATILDLIRECADADGGILTEHRDGLALLYRARETLYNQTPRLALDYAARSEVGQPLEPVDDDSAVRNDITRTRQGGSSGRAVLEEGALSVQAPPNGVGRYDDAKTLNLATDDQAEPIAYWDMHLGTWDEARFPKVSINLHRAPHLIPQVLALQLGDRLTIDNPPPSLPPARIDQLVQGYTEVLGIRTWRIAYNCTPAGPWTVGEVEAADALVDTDGSQLDAAVDEDATLLEVYSPPPRDDAAALSPWITSDGPGTNLPDEFPLAANVGGEEVSVTACEPLVWDQFTRVEAATWGTSSSGHPWSEEGGVTTDRSVNGSAGLITLVDSPSSLRFQYLTDVLGDCEVLVSVTPDQLATGAALLPAILLRVNVGYYRCRLLLGTDGSVGMDVTNQTTAVGSSASTTVTYSAGTTLWLRARIVGQRVLGRVWRDDGMEPLTWHVDETVESDTIEIGGVGVSASAFGSNTNTDPQLAFDGFRIVAPQAMTVVRSVNGITKSHTAGTDVRLAYPTHVAL